MNRKKTIQLTESELIRVIKRVLNESPLGLSMMEKLYSQVSDEYENASFDKGDRNFDPYIYIPINKKKKTGLLIELDNEDNFEIHYDDGEHDRPWSGWKKGIKRLNSPKNTIKAINLFMKKHKK